MQLDNTDLHVRLAAEQDLDFLKKLYRSTRDDLLQMGLPEAVIDNLLDMQFRAQLGGYRTQFPHARHCLVEKHGEAVGSLITNDGSDEIRLVYIALLPQERNKGNGRRLLEALQAEALTAKKPLKLSVDPRNAQAVHLYLSAGFQQTGNDGANLEMLWRSNERELEGTAT